MKKLPFLIVFFLIVIINAVHAQDPRAIDPDQPIQRIEPNRPYAFTPADTMWVLSDEAFTEFLKASQELIISDRRIELLQEKIQVGEERSAAYDEMVGLKDQEIKYWESQARELQSRNVDLQLEVLSQKKLKGLAFLGGIVISGAAFLLIGN